jgi:hypothetical protein
MQSKAEQKIQFGIVPNLLMHDNECMINLVVRSAGDRAMPRNTTQKKRFEDT